MRVPSLSVLLPVLLSFLASPGVGSAEPASPGTSSATEAVKARDAEIRAALPPSGEEPSPAQRARLGAIVTKAIDLRVMLERAMDRNWAKATPQQRRRMVGAFEKRFRALSGTQLDAYRATDVAYGAEVPAPGGAVNVPTRVVVNGEPTEITYLLRRGRDGWRIEDIVIDGASTVDGFRSSFARTVAKEGVAGLVAKLEKAAAESAARKPGPGKAGKLPPPDSVAK
jgi:phospholipid transport system substrate-binding protein